MTKSIAFILAAFIGASAFAQEPAAASCEAKAAEKRLAGAAKTSFVKKCVSDAGAAQAMAAQASAARACEAKADEKKLAGAAKSSFVKKCEKDVTGG
ncbi:MAG: hypothetical protein ACK5AK_06615 [Gemmatimonas sp.]